MTHDLIHILSVGKHELWYRLDHDGVTALHKPTGCDPTRLYFSTFEVLQRTLPSIEREFDRVCPGCAEARISPLLIWDDVAAVQGAETTMDGHRFRVYRERFEDGQEKLTIVHTSEGEVNDFCFENAAELETAWPGLIDQVRNTCTGCAQLGE